MKDLKKNVDIQLSRESGFDETFWKHKNHKNLPKIQISKPEYSIKLFDIEIIFFRQILVLDFDLHCFWTSKSKFFANRSII